MSDVNRRMHGFHSAVYDCAQVNGRRLGPEQGAAECPQAWHSLTEESAGGEERCITLGTDALGRVLIVIYARRRNGVAAHFGPARDTRRTAAVREGL